MICKRKTIDKLWFTKNQELLLFKDIAKEMNKQMIDWKKIFVNHIFDKRSVSKTHKTLTTQKLKNKQFSKNGQRHKNHLTKEYIYIANKKKKTFPPWLVIRKCKLKPKYEIPLYNYHSDSLKFKKYDHTKCCQEGRATAVVIHHWLEYQLYNHFGKHFGNFL